MLVFASLFVIAFAAPLDTTSSAYSTPTAISSVAPAGPQQTVVVTSTTRPATGYSETTAIAPISSPDSQPTMRFEAVPVSNESSNLAVANNAAARDQTNNAVSQKNAADHQVVIGSQSSSVQKNGYDQRQNITNTANTNITSVDQSQHSQNNTSISNNNSQTQSTTVINEQNVVNRYETVANRDQPNLPQIQIIQDPVTAQLAGHIQTVAVSNSFSTENKLGSDKMMNLIVTAKETSDMAFQLALDMMQT